MSVARPGARWHHPRVSRAVRSLAGWTMLVLTGCGGASRPSPGVGAPPPATAAPPVTVRSGPTRPSPIAVVGRVRVVDDVTADAVARLEAFVAAHPDEPRFTPDALLRLGSLHLDEAEAAFDDRPDDVPALAGRALAPLADARARFPAYPRLDAVLYQLAYAHELVGDGAAAREAYLALGALTGSPLVDEAWFRAGELAFDDGDLPAALAAYGRVGPRAPFARLAAFKQAWSHWRAGDMTRAAAGFQAVLDDPGATLFAPEARQYLALALVEDDQDGDGAAEPPAGPTTAAVARVQAYLGAGPAVERRAVAEAAAAALTDEARFDEALAVLDHLLALAATPDERARLAASRADVHRRDGRR